MAVPTRSDDDASREQARRYRKVSVELHSDDRYLALSRVQPSGQSLWLHLLIGPHTSPIPGLSRAGRASIAEDLGWSLKAFDEAFAEVSREGLAKADWDARVLWLPNALKHNLPQSPNVVRGWRQHWALIPSCEVKAEAHERLFSLLVQRGEPFRKAFDEACPKPFLKSSAKAPAMPCPNQEQEQESIPYQEEVEVREVLPSTHARASRTPLRTIAGAGR